MSSGSAPYNPYQPQVQGNLNQALGAVSSPQQIYGNPPPQWSPNVGISTATLVGHSHHQNPYNVIDPEDLVVGSSEPEDKAGIKRKEQIKALKRYLKNA